MTAQPAPATCPSCGADTEPEASVCGHCSSPLVVLPQVHAGFVISSRYEIVRALGAGGMGIVYEARDRLLDEVVAIKLLRPGVAGTSEMAQRFRSEIKIARAVSHKNVCRIHEYGEDRGLRYISMAFVEGIDLRRVLREVGPLPPSIAFDVALQAAQGLEAIHAEGIVHRDLKPANVTVDAKGVVRVMDFGLAKQAASGEPSSGSAGQMVGTPDYMSPEQIRGVKLDSRSDLYSLGVVVYELFAGRAPFRSQTPVETILKHLNETPVLDDVDSLPPGLLPVLRRSLQKDPAERYASAAEMGRALDVARSITVGDERPDFAALFALHRARPAAGAAAAEPAPTGSVEGLSQATWTTAVGRAVAPPGTDDHEAPFFVAEAAPESGGFVVHVAEPLPELELTLVEPPPEREVSLLPEREAPPLPEPEAAPASAEPEEAGIEVPGEDERVAGADLEPAAAAIDGAPTEAVAQATTSPSEPAADRPAPRATARPAPPRTGPSPAATLPPRRHPLTSRLMRQARANPRAAVLVAAAPLTVVAAGIALSLLGAPVLATIEPSRVAAGGSVTLSGKRFAANVERNRVLFGGDERAGRVLEATPERLVVALPELNLSPWMDSQIAVTVRTPRGSSEPLPLTVFPLPRILGLEPDSGVPGDVVLIKGSGWTLGSTVRFGRVVAEAFDVGFRSIRVRVPAMRVPAGGRVPVVVVSGDTASEPASFQLRRPSD